MRGSRVVEEFQEFIHMISTLGRDTPLYTGNTNRTHIHPI